MAENSSYSSFIEAEADEYNPDEEGEEETKTPPREKKEGEIEINIRTLGSGTKVVCMNPKKATLLDLKKKAFPNEIQTNKIIRLIYSGQILNQNSKTLKDLNIIDGAFIHSMINTQEERNQTFDHIPLGLTEDDKKRILDATIAEDHKGFDRFLTQGFTFNEIEVMRLHFHTWLLRQKRVKDLKDSEKLIEIEEAWISGEINTMPKEAESAANTPSDLEQGQQRQPGGLFDILGVEEEQTIGGILQFFWGVLFGYLLFVLAFLFALRWKTRTSQLVGMGFGSTLRLILILSLGIQNDIFYLG